MHFTVRGVAVCSPQRVPPSVHQLLMAECDRGRYASPVLFGEEISSRPKQPAVFILVL